MKHLVKHLRSVLVHKWYVFRAGRMVGASLWRLLVHDFSKFRPREFVPYAVYYQGDRSKWKDGEKELYELNYQRAWLSHLHANDHHWQHYILRNDEDRVQILPMSWPAVREMVADWMGAGRTYQGTYDMTPWLKSSLGKTVMHPVTIGRLWVVLGELGYDVDVLPVPMVAATQDLFTPGMMDKLDELVRAQLAVDHIEYPFEEGASHYYLRQIVYWALRLEGDTAAMIQIRP